MDASPLTQQDRPQVFKPKIHSLYHQLLTSHDVEDRTDGYWAELFSLPPDRARLAQLLQDTSANDLIQAQSSTQQLVIRAIDAIEGRSAPSDEHALSTLAVFFDKVTAKSYHSPSTDLIQIFAGLDNVDAVFTDLVACLEQLILHADRSVLKSGAILVTLVFAAGVFNTSLLSYFVQRDLSTAIYKYLSQDEQGADPSLPLALLSILACYVKYEIVDVYQSGHSDVPTQSRISHISASLASQCIILRDQYIELQNDASEPWTIAGALSYLRPSAYTAAASKAPVLTAEQVQQSFEQQPQPAAAVLITLHNLVLASAEFRQDFVSQSAVRSTSGSCSSDFLSLASYLVQHAHRSSRAATYARLSVFIVRALLEDPTAAKGVCVITTKCRLCRQRPPYLPQGVPMRPQIATVIDIIVDGINHNLRVRLDVALYSSLLGTLKQTIKVLCEARVKIDYHWSELWRSLLSFIRFCTQYAENLRGMVNINTVLADMLATLTLSLTQGDTILNESRAMDDLFYKLVESQDKIHDFGRAYNITYGRPKADLDVLIGVADHFKKIVETSTTSDNNASAVDVMQSIKAGYETLSIERRDHVDEYASSDKQENRAQMRQLIKIVVKDAAALARVHV